MNLDFNVKRVHFKLHLISKCLDAWIVLVSFFNSTAAAIDIQIRIDYNFLISVSFGNWLRDKWTHDSNNRNDHHFWFYCFSTRQVVIIWNCSINDTSFQLTVISLKATFFEISVDGQIDVINLVPIISLNRCFHLQRVRIAGTFGWRASLVGWAWRACGIDNCSWIGTSMVR